MESLLHHGFSAVPSADSAHEDESVPGRDLFAIAKYLIPTDAHVVCGCLVAAGVPAVVADDNHVQANLLLAPALGGVRILVPEAFLQQGYEVLHAFERGDFQLRDDEDVGSPDPELSTQSKA